jgi:hypothetical protein
MLRRLRFVLGAGGRFGAPCEITDLDTGRRLENSVTGFVIRASVGELTRVDLELLNTEVFVQVEAFSGDEFALRHEESLVAWWARVRSMALSAL